MFTVDRVFEIDNYGNNNYTGFLTCTFLTSYFLQTAAYVLLKQICLPDLMTN